MRKEKNNKMMKLKLLNFLQYYKEKYIHHQKTIKIDIKEQYNIERQKAAERICFENELLQHYKKDKNIKKFLGVKVLCIADLHNNNHLEENEINLIKNGDYDFIVMLGDISIDCIKTISTLIPEKFYKHCYYILGNHDDFDNYETYGGHFKDLNRKSYSESGIMIAGLYGSERYKKDVYYPSYTQEESLLVIDDMKKSDIFFTHDSPYLLKGFIQAHCGLKGISKYIYKHHVPYHVHGHLHRDETKAMLCSDYISIGIYGIKIIEL